MGEDSLQCQNIRKSSMGSYKVIIVKQIILIVLHTYNVATYLQYDSQQF